VTCGTAGGITSHSSGRAPLTAEFGAWGSDDAATRTMGRYDPARAVEPEVDRRLGIVRLALVLFAVLLAAEPQHGNQYRIGFLGVLASADCAPQMQASCERSRDCGSETLSPVAAWRPGV